MLRFALALCLIAAPAGAAFDPERCLKEYRQGLLPFPDPDATPPRIVDESRPDYYKVRDTEHEDFTVEGNVVDGELRMRFQTKLEDGTRSALRAKEHFTKMLEHFAGRFTRIRGQWTVGPMSTNLDQFNWATRSVSNEEAALRTWTGRQAAAAGYTRVRFVTLEGRRGNYTRVVVLFEKP